MSDLVRGPAAAAPLPPVEEETREPEAPAAPPPAAPVATAPPSAPPRAARPAPAAPRLTLRAIDMAGSAPAAPAPAAPAASRAPTALNLSSLGTRPVAAPAPPPPPAPPAPRPVIDTPSGIFDEVHVFLAGVKEQIGVGGTPAMAELDQLMTRIVLALEDSAELFWLANAPAVPPGVDYLVAHQSRVAVLAARIGLNIGFDRPRAVALATAGAMIDIGLWQSPEALMRRLESLGPDEQAVYRAHPQRSAALLTQWDVADVIVEAVLQHHEREQGQGFPQRLTGTAISQDAKILGLVDAYTGLTLPSSRKPGLRPHEAIREIVRSKHESFSPALIKALLSEISVFPPGTLVRLNTGEVGQVVAVNRNHPLRPRVEVVADSKGNRPNTAKTIDLSETPFLYITGPVSDSTK